MPGLETFAENVWVADGPPVCFLGGKLPTRMIIVRLGGGSLWVNSPVEVEPDLMTRIKALGPVQYLVAPTKLHVWRLEPWQGLFPGAEMWGPAGVPNEFKHLPFAGILGDAPPPGWANDFDQLVFRGNFLVDEVFFLHKKSGTLIVADFIQNHRLEKGRPIFNTLLRLDGLAYPRGGVPYDIRLTFTNRTLARQSLRKLLAWDFDKLIIAHGVCIESDAKPFVERAFRWLAN